MIKTISLLFLIGTTITGCASSIKSQCDPDKNYIISNPEAMEEYKELRRKGIIKSYYTESTNPEKCTTDICVQYDPNSFDFIEMYFNDKERKGVYTIKLSNDITNENCIRKDLLRLHKDKDTCYVVTKNKNNEIQSRYQVLRDNSRQDQSVVSFIDLDKNIKLYEISYQIYLTGAIGGPGYGTCPPSKINNPDYKFDTISFPTMNH